MKHSRSLNGIKSLSITELKKEKLAAEKHNAFKRICTRQFSSLCLECCQSFLNAFQSPAYSLNSKALKQTNKTSKKGNV